MKGGREGGKKIKEEINTLGSLRKFMNNSIPSSLIPSFLIQLNQSGIETMGRDGGRKGTG